MSQEPFVPMCKRTGRCCTTILLDHSPRQLRESYEAWYANSSDNIVRLKDIFLVFPMLEGRCRGKTFVGGCVKYVYGPCKHLTSETTDGVTLAACSIHKNRPALCSGFPLYRSDQAIEMSARLPVLNPGYMRGCGYNADPNAGLVEDDLVIQPLEEGER